jgi:dolichyl-phosphate-mannose-protein mannosyltransferase
MKAHQTVSTDAPELTGPGGALWRHRRWLVAALMLLMLGQMAFAMVTAAAEQTPTIDEPVYVAAGAVYPREHNLLFNGEHPPLGKLIIGIGVALDRPHLDAAFPGRQYSYGGHFLYGSGNDPERLMLFARLPVVVLTLLFGLVVFAFAGDLAGSGAGLVALALYSFSPDVIANGSLATIDVPTIGFLLTSVWLVWRARRHPLVYLPLAGLALGAAVATKMNALAGIPVVAALAVLSVWHYRRRPERSGRAWLWLPLGVLAAVAVVALAFGVVWAAYLGVDPHLRWGGPHVAVHGWQGTIVDWLPAPKPFRAGMRLQLKYENHTFDGFLFGRRYHGSLWYYLPAALLVKTPLGALALWLAGIGAMLGVRRLRPAAVYLLLPAGVVFGLAMLEVRNFGVRYALVLPVFLAVAAGSVLAIRQRWFRLIVAGLVVFVAVSSIRTFPYYLPYSNEAFGGPSKTHLRLHDSNVDWGQDLGRLADRLRADYPGQQVWLVYQGGGLPAYYGLDGPDPLKTDPARVHGLLIVSDTRISLADARLTALLDTATPIGDVGHSLTIFRR